MNASLNPNPSQNEPPQLTNGMIATFDSADNLSSALAALNEDGFGRDQISIFFGKDGYESFDPQGTHHTLALRVTRVLQSFAGEEKVLQDATDALLHGQALISVLTDGSEAQKTAVEATLKANKGRNIHFFGRWAIEHL